MCVGMINRVRFSGWFPMPNHSVSVCVVLDVIFLPFVIFTRVCVSDRISFGIPN